MKTILIILFNLLILAGIDAQDVPDTNPGDTGSPDMHQSFQWFHFGVGASNAGISGIIGLSVQHNNLQLSFRRAANTLVFGDNLWDLGGLIGVVRNPRHMRYSISAGLGVTGGSHRKSSNILDNERTPIPMAFGVPVEVQVVFCPKKHFGIGAYGFANFNTSHNFAGVAITWQFGNLR